MLCFGPVQSSVRHVAWVMRVYVLQPGRAGKRRRPGLPAVRIARQAITYAIWTLALWILFGVYVTVLWVIACCFYIPSRLSGRPSTILPGHAESILRVADLAQEVDASAHSSVAANVRGQR